MDDELVLVNIYGEKIGAMSKIQAHSQCKLHEAFSIFIFYKNEMLIQRRNKNKYHSGRLLCNACCSHPKPNESLKIATSRRLKEELNIECELFEIDSFIYHSKFQNGLHEYELDHIFIGKYPKTFIAYNTDEIEELLWMDLEELSNDLIEHPYKYTEWFLMAAPKVISYLSKNCN